jgi:MFS family permease
LALLGAAHSFNHSLFVIAPPLLTMIMNSLNVSLTLMSTVATIASFIYGFGALAGGPLGDKIGEARTIAISLAFSGLSTFIMLAAWITGSVYVYGLALVLMASWASLYHPTANSLISKAFKGKVAESMGLHGVGGTAGVVLTPVVAWFVGVNFGWAWAFVVFGIACIALALIFAKNFEGSESRKAKGGTIIDALKIRELWTLLILNVMIGLFMKSVELFFPTYLKDNRGVDQMWASVAYTLILAVGVPGQWIGGKASGKIGSKKVLNATMFGICLGLLLLILVPTYFVGIAAFIVLYGLAFYAHQPTLNSLTGFLSPQDQRGEVFGIFFFTSFGIGSLSQMATGVLADAYGFDIAFWMITAFAFAALLLSFKIPDKRETGHPINA